MGGGIFRGMALARGRRVEKKEHEVNRGGVALVRVIVTVERVTKEADDDEPIPLRSAPDELSRVRRREERHEPVRSERVGGGAAQDASRGRAVGEARGVYWLHVRLCARGRAVGGGVMSAADLIAAGWEWDWLNDRQDR